MHDVNLIMTLAVGFAAALVAGMLAQRLRLPPLVGYLLAGVAIGPFTPGPVVDTRLAAQLAEVGVILLMFGVGLHFSLEDLWRVRRIAVPGALAQIALATAMGGIASWWWGWSAGAGLVFGLALSVASTVVLLRALIERGIVESMDGRIAVGWLIVEDLATVLALVLLPAVAVGLGGTALATSSPAGGVLGTLALALGKLALFVGVMLVVGRRAVPWLLGRAAATGSRELLTLAVLAMSVGVAYFASRLFDVSFALGAFFAGILVGRSNLSHKVAEDVLPLQDAFTVLFFVSVGMLFNPAALFDTPGRLVATIAIIVVGKSLVAAGIVWGFGHPPRTVLLVAASLAQVGEFSFILAELGLQLGLLPDEGRNLILAGAIVSISLNPFVFAGAGRLHAWLAARSVAAERPLPPAPLTVDWLHGHAIIVGAGRVGRVVAAALRAAAVPHLLVEQNRGVAEDVRREGATVLVGDATRLVVLEHAGLADARLLVVAIPSPAEARAVVALARDANPALRIVVRTHDLAEGAALELNGADLVVMGETELAKAMVAFALREARAPGPSR